MNVTVTFRKLIVGWRNVVLVRGGVGEGENNPLGRHAEREDWFRGEGGGSNIYLDLWNNDPKIPYFCNSACMSNEQIWAALQVGWPK